MPAQHTEHDGVFQPLRPIFHGRHFHCWSSAGATKVGFAKHHLARELSEDVSFDLGTVLVVEQSSLEKTPQGYVMIHRRIRYVGIPRPQHASEKQFFFSCCLLTGFLEGEGGAY